MDGWMDGWIDGWMDEDLDGQTHGWIDGQHALLTPPHNYMPLVMEVKKIKNMDLDKSPLPTGFTRSKPSSYQKPKLQHPIQLHLQESHENGLLHQEGIKLVNKEHCTSPTGSISISSKNRGIRMCCYTSSRPLSSPGGKHI